MEKNERLDRAIIVLKRTPALQNWVALTVVSLLCYAFVAWYFMAATSVFGWSGLKTVGWLGVLLWFVVLAISYRYNKNCQAVASAETKRKGP